MLETEIDEMARTLSTMLATLLLLALQVLLAQVEEVVLQIAQSLWSDRGWCSTRSPWSAMRMGQVVTERKEEGKTAVAPKQIMSQCAAMVAP